MSGSSVTCGTLGMPLWVKQVGSAFPENIMGAGGAGHCVCVFRSGLSY